MSDTIKFRRYNWEVPDGIERDAAGNPVFVGGSLVVTPRSGKVVDYGDISPRTIDYTKEALRVAALVQGVLRGTSAQPLTRRERVQRWISERWDRVVLAWRVLRGDDIHEGCD